MKNPLIMEFISREMWAVMPQTLEAITRIVTDGTSLEDPTLFHGAHAEMREIESTMSAAAEDGGGGAYNFSERLGNVGVIRVEGPIIPRASLQPMSQPKMTTCSGIQADLASMESDTRIDRIALVVDSPGGAATGLAELAAQIRTSKKPVHAYVAGNCASAAYWIASAADKIVASKSASIGSIGVVGIFNNKKKDGTVEIVSSQSPNKRPDLETDEGRADVQAHVDDLADVFISSVAENRGTTTENVLERYGRGSMFIASKALDRGMIDGVSTLADFLADFRSGEPKRKIKNRVDPKNSETGERICEAENPASAGHNEETTMTLNELLAQSPEAKRELEERVVAERAAAVAALRTEMKFAATIAAADQYPSSIRGLASAVLAGEKSKDALDGAVTLYEAQVEEKKSAEAKAAEGTLPETPAQASEKLSEDHVVRSEADFRAAVKRARGER